MTAGRRPIDSKLNNLELDENAWRDTTMHRYTGRRIVVRPDASARRRLVKTNDDKSSDCRDVASYR
jgi:hypothetical protein